MMCHSERIPAERSIFVSYAHEDRKILEGLRKPLLALQRYFGVQFIWDDMRLRVGDNWDQEIQIYLTRAPLAILLVSQDFAASDYIQTKELPTLLNRYSCSEVVLLPVMVGPVDLDVIKLKGFHTIPPPECPLRNLNQAKREYYYFELGLQVKEILMRFLASASPTVATRLNVRKGTVSQRPLTALDSADPLSWRLTIPADVATDEIEHQLRRLINQTKRRGFLVFSRGAHYVQYAFYKEFDVTSVIIEVISNAYLPGDFPLSKLQMQRLLKLGFTQWSDEENLILLAPVDTENSLGKLSIITWHILDDVLNCRWDSDLEVSGQCW